MSPTFDRERNWERSVTSSSAKGGTARSNSGKVDHAYAVTIHKSQGSTVEHSIMYAPVRPGKLFEKEPDLAHEEFGRTSYNALNVAVTHARFGTRVFTNSIADLTRSVETVDGKTSTLKRLREPERDLPS